MKDFAKKRMKIIYLGILIILASCKSQQRNTTYFEDIRNNYESTLPIENKSEIRIQSNDQLSITINSLNAETNNLFNTGSIQSSDSPASNSTLTSYLVDKDGFVRLPVLGKIKFSELTIEEATNKLTNLISENYVKNPVVTIRIVNFKITIIGEVKGPQSLNVENGKINLIEALARVGDITPVGDPKNILIVREKGGFRSTMKINLLHKEAFNSPYFYLHQNDIVYVQPDKLVLKQKDSASSRNTIALVISVVSVLSLIYYRFF